MVLTFELKTTEQCFSVVANPLDSECFLVVLLYKVMVLTFFSKSYGMTKQMKATENYLPVVMLITLYKGLSLFSLYDYSNKALQGCFPVQGYLFLSI